MADFDPSNSPELDAWSRDLKEDLRDGGGCNIDNFIKVKRWFIDNWPEGTAWPEGVSRSLASEAAE